MGEKEGPEHKKSAGQNKSDSWFPTLWSIHVASGFVYDYSHSWESLGVLVVFYFKIQHSRIQVLCFYSCFIRKEQSENFNLPPRPYSQHCWDDLMPHNRSNFVIMTQKQQLKNIACFRAYTLVVGNWQQNVFSNPLKWYLIASWHGNYCICTVPEEFQPKSDRELIKSPRCNWRFWLHCLRADQH